MTLEITVNLKIYIMWNIFGIYVFNFLMGLTIFFRYFRGKQEEIWFVEKRWSTC